MELKQAVKTLRRFNAWRRYDGPVGEGPNMPDPKDIGQAIDTVCGIIEKGITWQTCKMVVDVADALVSRKTEDEIMGMFPSSEDYYKKIAEVVNEQRGDK